MKKTMFFLVLSWPILTFAQQRIAFDFSAAPNYTFYTKPIFSSPEGRLAYDFGAGFSYKLKNEYWAIVGGLRFSSFSTSSSGSELLPIRHFGDSIGNPIQTQPTIDSIFELFTSREIKSNFNFIEIPVGLSLVAGRGKIKFKGQATIGPTIFLTKRTVARYGNPDGTAIEKTESGYIDGFRRLNAVGSLSAGIQFSLSPRINMQLMPHGDLQLFSISKNSQTGARFYSVGLRIGASYLL